MEKVNDSGNLDLKVDQLVDSIFKRKYYTNHGPELIQLESELEILYPGHNVLGLANFDIAFLISILALGAGNIVMVPTLIEQSIYQALVFLKRKLEYVPINSQNGLINLAEDSEYNKAEKGTKVLVVNNTFGNTPNIIELYSFAKKNNASVVMLSKDGFGIPQNYFWPNDVLLIELFDFSRGSLINAEIGAAVKCNDKLIAEKIRNIRSSYGAREKLLIPFTGNGRMSEFQAALIRNEMKNMSINKGNQYETYKNIRTVIEGVPGVQVVKTDDLTTTPFFNKVVVKTTDLKKIDFSGLNEELTLLKLGAKNYRRI